MPARVGHRAGVYVPGLADCVFDLVGDRPKGGGTSTDLEGLPELGCKFYNDTGGALTKGTLVYVSGYSTKRARTVTKSQAGVSVAEWVVAETTANGAFGYLVKAAALIADLDTSGSSVGSLVYASSATAGALTLTATAQRVGRVGSVSASGGDGVVLFDLWATGASSVGGSLNILDTGTLTFGTGGTDVVVTADGTDAVVTGTGDVVFADSVDLKIGTGKDIGIAWDGTRLNVTQAATNSEIRWGVDGAGIDMVLYGDTASTNITWDQSADKLILSGVAKIQCQTIAAATGTAIPVTHSGSFPITQNGAETNTLADPTFIGQWLSIFVDTDTSGARVITAASRINQAGNTTITLTEVGDFIKLEAITIAGALKWQVVANDGAALS